MPVFRFEFEFRLNYLGAPGGMHSVIHTVEENRLLLIARILIPAMINGISPVSLYSAYRDHPKVQRWIRIASGLG